MACDPEDDVDRLFACFKCGISTPESAIKERRLHPETSKKAGLVRGKASTVVEIATSSLSEQFEDASAHPLPLPPPVRSHLKLSTTHKKHSVAFLDPFVVMLTLCSNGLPHDGDNADELWYVLTLPVKEEVIHNLTNFFSSKAGKNSFLLPTGRFKCKDMTEQEVFMESLICRMDSDCNKLLKCQIDTDCKKTLYFDFEVQQQTSDALQHTALNAYRSDFPSTYSSGKSPFPALDAFVEFIASSGNVLVMYIADLQRAIYYQKCYDPDCRGYRSPLRPLPHDVIPSDILLFDSTQRINYREDLDTNFGLEPDGSHMEHCSCDGDELVTDSCNMENSWWQEAMTYADHIENMKNAPEFKILNEENAGDCSWWMDVEKLASLVEGQLG
ncbi:coiled-coil domain-containing protein 111 [Musa troglodytarum]|uniref:DNA-directed primase/polymerase protein n=1 Tax=Musa troglodytarum TaxID=320322 RepID=A0A9E7K8C6_9LILI|nr:coiled-coil domain-containing protein 111 [Musa troglodytarum]